MINTDDNSDVTAKNNPERAKRGLDLSPTQIIAGGGAAAVASVIGGHLGLGGTVIGAFVLSVITAVAVPLFRASLEKSHEQLRRVVPRRDPHATRATQQEAAPAAGIIRATSGTFSAAPLPPARTATAVTAPRRSLPSRGRMAFGAAAIFMVGLGSVVGVQAATGASLSDGTAALQTGISQVASNTANTSSTPATNPQPSARAVIPNTSPTEEATSPTMQNAASQTPTGKAGPTQTTTAGKATSQASLAPAQATPTSGPSGAAYGAAGQGDPGPAVPTTVPTAK